ncbi:hypothetical protein [Gillisia marina]|uniref:hypothetical protein n=1 Tax=Gillisia marina TaxID=1167637 RepID=UPI00029B3397|nr:hypothetical protein [Gillisia marina]
MKTSTLLKRTMRTASFLIMLLILLSFKAEEPRLNNYSENFKELTVNAKQLNTLTRPIRKNINQELVAKDADVLLEIDTEDINESNLDSKVVFINIVDGVRINSGSPKEFLTKVEKNIKVFWEGVPKESSSNATIDILDIRRKSNQNNNAKILKFSTKQKKGKKVEIKVKNKKITGEEYYEVQFRIIYEDNSTKTFWVDPKLEMKI